MNGKSAIPETPPNALLITRNLPPLRGGMERLNLHMAQSLSDWCNLVVIGPEGCSLRLPETIEVLEVPAAPLWRFLLSARQAVARLSTHPFDFVLAGSGLTAPLARKVAKRANAKSVAYVHGLDLVANHPVYRFLWMPHLRRLDLALANSRNTADLAARRGVAGGRIRVVNPGVSLPRTPEEAGNEFRARHQLGKRPMLLSVGRLTRRKGLAEFVRHVMPAIRRSYPDVALVVIGDEAPDALSGAGLGSHSELQKLAAELEMSNSLFMFGPCDDQTLEQAYFAADVHVFPVREVPGDVEGFGMVAIEAAAHGLPTIAFAVGGVPDAVESGRSGYLVRPDDYKTFSERVCELLATRAASNWKETARETADKFTWEVFGTRLRQSLVPNKNGKYP